MVSNRFKLLVAQNDLLGRRELLAPFESNGFSIDEAETVECAFDRIKAGCHDAAIVSRVLNSRASERDIASTPSNSMLDSGRLVLERFARLDMDKRPAVWLVDNIPGVLTAGRDAFPFLVRDIETRLTTRKTRELSEEIRDYLSRSTHGIRPDQLITLLRKSSFDSLETLFGIIGKAWGILAFGFIEWSKSRSGFSPVPGALWQASAFGASTLPFSQEMIAQAIESSNRSWMSTYRSNDGRLYCQSFVGAITSSMRLPQNTSFDGFLYFVAYATTPDIRHSLPLDNEKCDVLRRFHAGYCSLPQNQDVVDLPLVLIGKQLEQAIMQNRDQNSNRGVPRNQEPVVSIGDLILGRVTRFREQLEWFARDMGASAIGKAIWDDTTKSLQIRDEETFWNAPDIDMGHVLHQFPCELVECARQKDGSLYMESKARSKVDDSSKGLCLSQCAIALLSEAVEESPDNPQEFWIVYAEKPFSWSEPTSSSLPLDNVDRLTMEHIIRGYRDLRLEGEPQADPRATGRLIGESMLLTSRWADRVRIDDMDFLLRSSLKQQMEQESTETSSENRLQSDPELAQNQKAFLAFSNPLDEKYKGQGCNLREAANIGGFGVDLS